MSIDYLKPKTDSQASSASVVTSGHARFTVLTPRVIRMEYAATGEFEDRPSQVFWHRNQPVPEFEVRKEAGDVHIITRQLHLIHQQGKAFTPESLQIKLLETEKNWRYGDPDLMNLGGTVRTLDSVNGSTQVDPGLLSRNGWTLIDDSTSLVFNEEGMLQHRKNKHKGQAGEGACDISRDLYFFGYGLDYHKCLQEYFQLTGSIPMVPRYVLGNWWSRYWAYSQEEITGIVREFKKRELPLSVVVLDLDWHIRKNKYGSGWTGYTWNRELFPDPEGFCRLMHEMGVGVTLNLHPHAGVLPHEEAYREFAENMDMDPASEKPIPFDICDPRFVENYFKLLHHPHEQMGVDFWWMDWQQGKTCALEGLDPLYMINHLHFLDNGRDRKKRPMLLSRWPGLGGHRYPVAFAGDILVTWESLAFEPWFNATSSNVGCCYWSHDVGGHIHGMEEPELFVRWVQFNVFSAIMRFHSTQTEFQDRRPWVQGEKESRIIGECMRLRQALIPYLYTLNHQCTTGGLPPIRPMYYDYPDQEEAYSFPDQYLFGELIAALFVTPMDADIKLSRKVFWLPEGQWYHFFTGEKLQGSRVHACYGDLDDMPVFAREGALVPMDRENKTGMTQNPENLRLKVFSGADGEFTLYEDDGVSQDYREDGFCQTRIWQKWSNGLGVIGIKATEGASNLIPSRRSWNLEIHGCGKPVQIKTSAGSGQVDIHQEYDSKRELLQIVLPPCSIKEDVVLEIATGSAMKIEKEKQTFETFRRLLHGFRLSTEKKEVAARLLKDLPSARENIPALSSVLSETQFQAFCEICLGGGCEWFRNHDANGHIVLWNNDNHPGFHFSMQTRWFSWRDSGKVPRFRKYTFNRTFVEENNACWPKESWYFLFNYCGGLVKRGWKDRLGTSGRLQSNE